MFESFAPQHRVRTVILLSLAAVSAASAALAGINDNPPGAVLAALSGALLVTAFIHHWRSPRKFLMLSAGSVAVGIVLGVLGVGIDVAATAHRLPGPVAPAIEAAGAACLLAIAFLGLPSVFVGLAGALVAFLARRRT